MAQGQGLPLRYGPGPQQMREIRQYQPPQRVQPPPQLPHPQHSHPQQYQQHPQHPQQQQQHAPPVAPLGMPSIDPLQPVEPGHTVNRPQALFSSYASRLRQSEDNALLVPNSYIRKRHGRSSRLQSQTGSDDDEFDDTPVHIDSNNIASTKVFPVVKRLRSSDDEDEDEEEENDENDDIDAALPLGLINDNAQVQSMPYIKTYRYPTQKDCDLAAKMPEILVPIRLDLDLDDYKLRDVFVWNLNEPWLTPDMFAETLCRDVGLEVMRYAPTIAESIRNQVMDFESIYAVTLPTEDNMRVDINLDLQVGKVNLRDRFEWDLANVKTKAPEEFSRQLAAEMSLGGEFVPMIAHAIREQVYRLKRQLVEDYVPGGTIKESLPTVYRHLDFAASYTPQLDVLSNEELEKLLIAQERNIRRLRRENRFKRSKRRSSLSRHQSSSNVGTPS
ncbi:hypothetical protein BC940DRAFT_297157 [Gongronella butleri]|nr:hypothetical protein BC940DRAFT_297157 [Gongronella butleri]